VNHTSRSFIFPETVQTRRLLLRKPLPQDADAIFDAYAQDREVTRHLLWQPHSSVETTREFLEQCKKWWEAATVFPYVITRRTDRELLGMIDCRLHGHRAAFGYVLARRYWGEGLMHEALSALIPVALALPFIFRVEATCDVENRASARTLEKAGLVREGLLRRYTINPNISPEPRDSLMYAITKAS